MEVMKRAINELWSVKIIMVSHWTFDWPNLVYVRTFLGQVWTKAWAVWGGQPNCSKRTRRSVSLATFSKGQCELNKD